MLLTMVFFSGFCLGISSTLIDAHTLPGQTEGLKVGCGGKNKVFIKPLALGRRNGWMGGLQKLITVLDMRNGHKGGV